MHTIAPLFGHPARPAARTTPGVSTVVVGVPCDGRRERLEALVDTAAELGHAGQCPVVLLHSIRRQSDRLEPADALRARRVRATRELLTRARRLLTAKAGDRFPVTTVSSLLPPVTALVETGGFGGLLLLQQWSDIGEEEPSALIAAVAAQAHCPVLVQDRTGARRVSAG